MTEPAHADFEALSAYVDGEAPEWAAHVAGCPACAATADGIRAVAAAIATPVRPAAGPVREAALAAALGGAGAEASPDAPVASTRTARAVRPGPRARWVYGAAAAVFVVALGVAAVLGTAGRSSTDRTNTLAGPAAESNQGAAADSATSAAPVGNLGDVPDAATLRARARPALGAKATAPSAVAGGAAPAAAAPAPAAAAASPAPGATTASPTVTPDGVAARACEAQARARQPSLGPLVYLATASHAGAPAVVLGFSTGPDPTNVTLLLLARDGCAELLRAAGP
jgi:hypothetical protein